MIPAKAKNPKNFHSPSGNKAQAGWVDEEWFQIKYLSNKIQYEAKKRSGNNVTISPETKEFAIDLTTQYSDIS